MKKIGRSFGVLLATVGFVGLFGEASSTGAQILWTCGALTLMLIGHALWQAFGGEAETE